VATKN